MKEKIPIELTKEEWETVLFYMRNSFHTDTRNEVIKKIEHALKGK